MNVTKEIREKAAKTAKEHGLSEIWMNKGGEFFTSENLASLSVKGKKEEYAQIDVTVKVSVEKAAENENGK
jgi:hypothetical protein